jgi:hypothetical protein
MLIGVLLAGSGGVVAATTGDDPRITPIARGPARTAARPHGPGELCAGGLDAIARIEIVPDRVVEQGGRQRVEYHSEIAIDRGEGVGVAWTADVIDDRGAQVVAQLDAGTFAGRGGNLALTGPLVANLADGFYTIRVRAALTATDEPDTVLEAAQHVEVAAGRWNELADDEWFARSRASQAFSAAEILTRGL